VIVLKFGGSSLGDIDQIRKVLSIIETRKTLDPVVVVSAFGEITDVLERLACQSLELEEKQIIDEFNNYFEPKLYRLVHGVVKDNNEQRECLSGVNRLLQELKNVFRGLTIIHELTPRAMDKVLSYGELFSRTIIVHALASLDLSPVAISASECIITDDRFGQAKVNWTETEKALREKLLPNLGDEQIPVMQGFIGGTESGTVTTLGRGGSDYTAAIIGAICEAEEIQIWTDVNGFLTADPSIIPEATTIPELNIYEARELAHFGARVLHPKSVLPAIEQDIPVYIKNTFEPDHEGTLLTDNASTDGIHGMTALKDLCLITLEGNQSEGDGGIQWEQVISPEVYLRISAPAGHSLVVAEKSLPEVQSLLSDDIEVTLQNDRALIALVGGNLTTRSEQFPMVMDLLHDFEYELFTYAPLQNRWLLLVDGFQVDEILRKLYYTVFHHEQGDLN